MSDWAGSYRRRPMDHDHMLAPASHRTSSSHKAALGPPPPPPLPHHILQHQQHQQHQPRPDSQHNHPPHRRQHQDGHQQTSHYQHDPRHPQQPQYQHQQHQPHQQHRTHLPPHLHGTPQHTQVLPPNQLPSQHYKLNPINPPPPPAYAQATSPPMSFAASPPSDPLPSTLPPLSPPSQHDSNEKTLPSLSTVTGEHALRGRMAFDQARVSPSNWPPLDAPMAYRQAPIQQADSPAATMEFDGNSSIASAPSPDRTPDGSSTNLALDDPDVRLAAEALGDLRADFVSSPPDMGAGGQMSPPPNLVTAVIKKPQSPHSEPLFSLLTTSHPFLASTIGGATSAYGGAKNFSPRFKSGAEYVEGYLTPIANTVGSVGRVTGVEGGVRWFLGGRRRHAGPTDDDSIGNSKKRRKMINGDTKGDREMSSINQRQLSFDGSGSSTPKSDRRLSTTSTVDTLPAYDEMRSPAYTESAVSSQPPSSTPANNAAWQSRLIMSTSGLSIAMSAESLRSLKYCLRWLRWSNDHMGSAIGSLKTALEDYEKAGGDQALQMADSQDGETENGETREKTPQQSRTELAAKINTLKVDILKSLQDVITNVSKYAGGALPENARVLVRRHLTSLPQRFRIATMAEPAGEGAGGDKDSDSAMVAGAQKVLVLAKEGLDMVTQVSGVLDGTIVSAEEWCERMGKRRRRDQDEDETMMLPEPEPQPQPQPQPSVGMKMG